MSLHYLVKKKQVAAERLLLTRTTFSQSVMVSVGVGVTALIFVDPGAKVNGAYYRDVFLSQQLLPMMRTQAAFMHVWHGIDQTIIDNVVDECSCAGEGWTL